MADTKISELSEAGATIAGDKYVIARSTNNFFVDFGTIQDYVLSGALASDIPVTTVGVSLYSDLNDLLNIIVSSGVIIEGGELSDNGDGTATLSAGHGIFKIDGTALGQFVIGHWDAVTNIAVPDDDINRYVSIRYISGVLTTEITTNNPFDDNPNTSVIVGTVLRRPSGSIIYYDNNLRMLAPQSSQMIAQRFIETTPYARATGGVLGETGVRNVTVTAGTWWHGLNKVESPAFDSSGSDTFYLAYRDGSGDYNLVSATQYDTLYYDDGTGTLHALSNDRYAVHWVFMGMEQFTILLFYGRGDYRLNEALESTLPPDLPDIITHTAKFIGRIIVQESSDLAYSIEQTDCITNLIDIGSFDHTNLRDVDTVNFNVDYAPIAHNPGTLYWDPDADTLAVDLVNSEVTLQIGQEQHIYVRNTSGVNIPDGRAVYITGSASSIPTVALAKADSESTAQFAGLATESILTGNTGYVTTYGIVRNLDTSSFIAGDRLWLSDTDAGELTNVKPGTGSYVVPIGKIIYSDASDGTILVHLMHIIPSELSMLNNVDITTPINYDRLEYNSSSGTWQNTSGLHVGTSTDYLTVNSVGHLDLAGAATAWNDFRVPITSTKVLGTKAPDLVVFATNGAGSQGVVSYNFSATTEEEVYFSVQMPHTWKEGTELHPHVHWTPTTTGSGNVVWGLEYTWANIGSVFGNTTIIYGTGSSDSTNKKHIITSLTNISSTGKTFSSMLMCRMFRAATNAADTYASDASLLEFDIHFEVGRFGTDNEYS